MENEDIHIGDVLLVRQWDDLIHEFGITEKGYIQTSYGLNESIKYLCGRQVEIEGEYDGACGKLYECIVYGVSNADEFYFAADELEPLPEEEWDIADDEEIKLLFG